MHPALKTENLVKCYGSRRALDGLTLAVPRQSITGLVGANGAGKTTLMLSVAGYLRPTSGTIDVLGNGPFDADIHGGRVAILPQDSELPLSSRAYELLVHYGRLQGLKTHVAQREARAMLEAVHLGDRLDSPMRTLSHGMRKRVMMAQCFIGYPELVLLDEPLSGLDPIEVAHMRAFIAARRRKQAIVISSHNLHDIEQLCDQVAFVEKGKLVRFASLEELTGRSSVLVYQLSRPVADLSVLYVGVPDDFEIQINSEKAQLICRYPAARYQADTVNHLLLPRVMEQTGVVTVAQGYSLESEYLRHVSTGKR